LYFLFCRVYKVLDSKFRTVVDCRLYWSSTFATCSCCIWIRTKDDCIACSGTAGGYGYHKASAAVENALLNANIKMAEPFGGAGTRAIETALLAVARAAQGRKVYHLIESYA